MNLSGQDCKQLRDALLNAFPTKSSLEEMLLFELEKKLDAIVGNSNLADIVFELIKKASAEGWIESLISGACESNPKNDKLQAIAQKLNKIENRVNNSKNHNIVNTAKEIFDCVNLSLIENQQLISPFLQNQSKREEVWSKVDFLFHGQRERGNFGTWKAILEAILETEENPKLQDAINKLIESLQKFHKSFYSYYRYKAEDPEKYETYKRDKHFVAYALNEEKSGFTDEEVAMIAEDYLNYLRGLVEEVGSITGRLEIIFFNHK
ncbi:hypothetical protein NIES2101_32035 [Calothrix sp. HK-06]|nr:hypothetical protein NIES2101_32035 [Calothrix sp. HK-06]